MYIILLLASFSSLMETVVASVMLKPMLKKLHHPSMKAVLFSLLICSAFFCFAVWMYFKLVPVGVLRLEFISYYGMSECFCLEAYKLLRDINISPYW